MDKYQKAAELIKSADALLISASNGLSITEGLHLFADNQAFNDLFGDLKSRYGIRCILHGCMGKWPTEEEKWGFWSRLVNHYSGSYEATPVMKTLAKIAEGKEYFIVTSNAECHFELSGFSPDRIYEVEGSWEHMQCSAGCHDTLYPAFDKIKEMAAAEKDGYVPSGLIPHCPECGAPMNIHLQADASFIHDHKAINNFNNFIKSHHNKKLVVLELGIGRNNQLIKAPLMRLVSQEPEASYITLNLGEIYIPEAISSRSIGIDGYLEPELAKIADCL